MKAIKVIDNSQMLVCTTLVLASLGYIGWHWFWICLVLTELNAYIWMKKEDRGKE